MSLGALRYSIGLILANLITLAHFSDSPTRNLPKPAGEPHERAAAQISQSRFDVRIGQNCIGSVTGDMLAASLPGAAGFLVLSQAFEGPAWYACSRCFETIPSRPSLQAWAKIAAPLGSGKETWMWPGLRPSRRQAGRLS